MWIMESLTTCTWNYQFSTCACSGIYCERDSHYYMINRWMTPLLIWYEKNNLMQRMQIVIDLEISNSNYKYKLKNIQKNIK